MSEKTNDTVLAEMDGIVAAPEHHKIVFENEQFRIVDFYVPPGDTVPVHTHKWPTINYVIKVSDFLSYDEHGNLKLDSRSDDMPMREGSVFSLPAFPGLHSVKNIGDGPIHGIAVEMKTKI